MPEKDLIYYQTKDSKEPFRDWLTSFRDKVTRARIARRLERVKVTTVITKRWVKASTN